MNTNEFLNELRKLRSALFTIRVGDFIKKQNDQTKKDFVDVRTKIMNMVDKLEIADLQSIADDLAQNEQEFKDAAAALKKDIEDLDNAVKVIKTISKVVSVVGKIASVII